MKPLIPVFMFITATMLLAQSIPNLPIPLGAGSAEVYQNEIYYFGGSDNWSGSTVYPRIYKFDGQSWAYHDSIPDNNLWDVETVLVGDEVYLISGWPGGAGLLRKYNFTTREWTYLPDSPNTSTWGVTAEYLNGHIYLFQPSNGNVYDYNIADSTWTTRTSAGITSPLNLSSILYRDEIYIIGYSDTTFIKYTPSSDSWTQLAKSPYPVGASAMGIINDKIYNIGGNENGSRYAEHRSVIVYDITQNGWSLDSLKLSGKRHWMASASWRGGLYVLGGIDSTSTSVDIVEQIVPQGTATALEEGTLIRPQSFRLFQNYPNPFNPVTHIRFNILRAGHYTLSLYNSNGRLVQQIFDRILNARPYTVTLSAGNLSSGVYYYRLKGNGIQKIRKLVLLK